MLTKKYINQLVHSALLEDLGREGDITSKVLIPKSSLSKATIVVKEKAVICGTEFAKQAFKKLDKSVKIRTLKKDGELANKGDKIITISGKTQNILTAERTALNFLGLMSGVASKAKEFSDIANPYGSKIYSTRKTIPGIRKLEKYALTIGGAYINRETLDDFFFIKDNHLKTNSDIKECIRKLRLMSRNKKITVEVDNLNQLKEIINEKVDVVLLDNMTPVQVKTCLKIVNGRFECEASGKINLKNLLSYAKTKVNRISIGQLTHSINNVDFGLDI